MADKKQPHSEATVVAFPDNRSPFSVNGVPISITTRTGATADEVYETVVALVSGMTMIQDKVNANK